MPTRTGLRGSHPGSFDAAHSLRDGTFWDSAGKPEDTGETYDLAGLGWRFGAVRGLQHVEATAVQKERVIAENAAQLR